MNPFRIVGVIGKHRDVHWSMLSAVTEALTELGCQVLLEANPGVAERDGLVGERVSRAALAQRAELAVVVGGDGTLLNAGRSLAPAGVPLLGVNQGRLGFMADVHPDRVRETLAAVIGGNYQSELRMTLGARVCRAGEEARAAPERLAVNDVVIRSVASIRMLEFDTWIGSEFISSHRADGLIVASPTGSTAYALSGGGPLLQPTLQAMVLVPICPHTLSDRPIVVGADRKICIVARTDERLHALVAIDGHDTETLSPGDTVEVFRSPHPLHLIHPPDYSYFGILRNKLRWGSGPDVPPQRA